MADENKTVKIGKTPLNLAAALSRQLGHEYAPDEHEVFDSADGFFSAMLDRTDRTPGSDDWRLKTDVMGRRFLLLRHGSLVILADPDRFSVFCASQEYGDGKCNQVFLQLQVDADGTLVHEPSDAEEQLFLRGNPMALLDLYDHIAPVVGHHHLAESIRQSETTVGHAIIFGALRTCGARRLAELTSTERTEEDQRRCNMMQMNLNHWRC